MKKRFFFGILFAALFAGFTYLVRAFDVAAIGPGGTTVGFSDINITVHELTGVHMLWYRITDMLGYVAIGVAAIFALAGLVQMIKRRSLLKVDREIVSLGILFVVVIGLYVLFEKVVINYRPILMDGELLPEPSYPSSHTMLITVVMGASMMLAGRYLNKGFLRTLLTLFCLLILLVTIGGRIFCGVHWFTDIVGGLLLSISLLEFYGAALPFRTKDRKGDDSVAAGGDTKESDDKTALKTGKDDSSESGVGASGNADNSSSKNDDKVSDADGSEDVIVMRSGRKAGARIKSGADKNPVPKGYKPKH